MSTHTPLVAGSRDPATVLFGQTRRRVLGWLFSHPDQAFYLRQLTREAGAALGGVQRELAALEQGGLITRRVDGRQVYFQANQQCPVYPELRALLSKTVGAADVLRAALAPIADQISLAFVFGSAARGALRAGSDVDVLVIGMAPFTAVASATEQAQKSLGRDVNPTVYTEHEFRAKIAAGHHFLTSVLHEPIVFLIGGQDELERLGAEWMAAHPPEQPPRGPRPARHR